MIFSQISLYFQILTKYFGENSMYVAAKNKDNLLYFLGEIENKIGGTTIDICSTLEEISHLMILLPELCMENIGNLSFKKFFPIL